ncbi:MAG: CCA tRNA nucleotidyltransferase [Lachnospiraceae bacterium]|nr:CCA tRNA nucleotidyltransferase [Lachnospiraceae bacterium]
MKIEVPEEVCAIMDTLTSAGYEAYCVGGCVRDSLLGRTPEDWDITTSALPEQVKSLFSNTVDTGIQHGTVMIVIKGIGYEVTTYRIDGKYLDGRHPEHVTFTRSLEEDLKRRDFTINAFAYRDGVGIVDLFGGMDDLEKKIVRAVGDPDARFTEDALRIMRAIRFAAQLDFEVEEKTYAAIRRHADNLANVSMERIRVELEKTLMSQSCGRVNEFFQLGMGEYIVPGYADKCTFFDEEIAACLPEEREGDARRYLLLAILLKQLSDEEAKDALRAMKYDNKTKAAVAGILRYADQMPKADRIWVKQALNQMGEEIFFLTLDLQEAITRSTFTLVREMAKDIIAKEEPYATRHLAVNGNDLIQAGIPEGTQMKDKLEALLDLVIRDPEKNTKEQLMDALRREL